MEYNFLEIENKWQKYWSKHKTYKAEIDESKPKFYVLDMFPYPSGAGLHVGHPLGYIASDIYARYKRLQGFNVLHPMGFDAYGLPAEQYAIQTGTHPEVTTEKNIKRYREQLDKIGFSFDWDREVRTCDPKYYKWTQWTFIQLFNSYYNNDSDKAEAIEILIDAFAANGNANVNAACNLVDEFTAEAWSNWSEKQQQEMLMNYRLAYLSDTMVNWCPELGTVLANDEVKEGLSERGGHPVERKLMKQWSLRITAYSQRLLDGLNTIDWSDSLKEVQKNWIGRSDGAMCYFEIKGFEDKLEIFTTRPDTMFGATYMVLAPEHEVIEQITSPDQKEVVEEYVVWAKNRSERERQSEVKNITGIFTGAYGINPLNGEEIQIWIADYVLAGYGTGAIMAVPAHDSRDYAFAKHFGLPIIQVVSGGDISEESYDAKEGKMMNSGFIMNWLEALILGIVQGLTEFLPVSSSGHLELGKVLLGVDAERSLIFTVIVHGATVLSTIVVFHKDIWILLKGIFQFKWNEETQYALKIFISMIPVVILGLLYAEEIESFFTGNMDFVGSMLIVTSALLAFTYVSKSNKRPIRYIDSLIIGIMQAAAVLPGISRSGSTIAGGILLGNKKELIAKFSFLMVLIPIIGANAKDLIDGNLSQNSNISPLVLMIGFIAAFLSGTLACKWMINIVKKGKLIYFSIYCFIIGLIAILFI